MKKNINILGLAIFIALIVSACQSDLHDEISGVEGSDNELLLEKAQKGNKSYIIQLDDINLIAELKGVKIYKERKNKVKGTALGILKKQGISNPELGFVYSNSIVGFSVNIAPGQLKKLLAADGVKSIHEDKVVQLAPPPGRGRPSDPDDGDDPDNPDSSQEVPWGITRVGGFGDGTGKTAWILDTGIDLDHPDLVVDANRGISVFTKVKDASLDDGNGHGSHVAGTIAASDNSFGVVGVAAGAFVVPVKVLDSRGSGSYSGVIAGVDHVGANGSSGDVANMSLSGPVYSVLDDAVKGAALSSGVIFVLAAGNDSDDVLNYSPARVNGVNVFTISAMDSSDKFAYFSNYGSSVGFCAPGVGIKSCYKRGEYNTLSGTSMAAPHVAGIALLGSINSDGNVSGDPDGDADPIAHR